MPVERTKQQKKIAAEKRVAAQTAVHSHTFTAKSQPHISKADENSTHAEMAGYVMRDLLKTALTSIVLFSVLIGIFFYLRYN